MTSLRDEHSFLTWMCEVNPPNWDYSLVLLLPVKSVVRPEEDCVLYRLQVQS